MKNLFIIFFLGAVFHTSIYCQSICETEPGYVYNDQILNSSYKNVDLLRYKFCVKIHIHVIRRSDGTGGQSLANVNVAMGYLNLAYNPHDIYFHRIGSVHYIDNDAIFSNPNYLHSDFSYDLPNGINIYLADDNANYNWGVGDGWSPIFNTTLYPRFIVRGSWYGGTPLVRSHIMSHEMGHNFSLYHTHHGTYDEGSGDPYECEECADGSNGDACGDYIQHSGRP